MRYPEQLIAPMRADLAQYGIRELRTASDVDAALGPKSGTVMVVTNSVCGCAAGKARPGVGMALQHSIKPDVVASVFAGADVEAVARIRELLPNIAPSSPSVALFRDGKPVYVLHRLQIESRQAPEIAQLLMQAFDEHCVTAKQ